MLTKKHFITLANQVRNYNNLHPPYHHQGKPFTETQIAILADFCGTHSPRFDRELWLDYIEGKCGPSGGKLKAKA